MAAVGDVARATAPDPAGAAAATAASLANAAANPDGSGVALVGLTHSPQLDAAAGGARGGSRRRGAPGAVPAARAPDGPAGAALPPNQSCGGVTWGHWARTRRRGSRLPRARAPHAVPAAGPSPTMSRATPAPPPPRPARQAAAASLGISRVLTPLSCCVLDLIAADHNKLRVREWAGRGRGVLAPCCVLDSKRRSLLLPPPPTAQQPAHPALTRPPAPPQALYDCYKRLGPAIGAQSLQLLAWQMVTARAASARARCRRTRVQRGGR